MFTLADLKLWLKLENLNDKQDRYGKILNKIELLKAEQNELLVEHESIEQKSLITLSKLDKMPVKEAENLSKIINQKYNAHFSLFIGRLGEIKETFNKEEAKLAKLNKNEELVKAQQIKEEEFLKSFILISNLYQKGKISESDFQKVKNQIIKGGAAVGTIRNWADGKYKKTISAYGKEDWVKVSDITSGSAASAVSLSAELSRYNMWDLLQFITKTPDKYKDQPKVKLAKKMFDEKSEADFKYLRSCTLATLDTKKNRIESASYYTPERKAFEKNRVEYIIKEKRDEDADSKLSPWDLDLKRSVEFPVGTIREWESGKYRKEADGTWEKLREALDLTGLDDLEEGQYISYIQHDKLVAKGTITKKEEEVSIHEDEKTGERYTEVQDILITIKDEISGSTFVFGLSDTKKSSAIKIYGQDVTGFIPEKDLMLPFPEKIEAIKVGVSLGGSSDVKFGFWNKKNYVIKTARSETQTAKLQLQYEYVANKLYQTMGFAIAEGKLYGQGTHLVNNFIEGKTLQHGPKDTFEKTKKQLQDGYVLDCLLANWDVIGGAEDNIIVGNQAHNMGLAFRIDNGGSFGIKARGGTKHFGIEVNELETIKENNLKWFGDITEKQITDQIERIYKNKDSILRTFEWESNVAGINETSRQEVKNVLADRIEWLKDHNDRLIKERKEIESRAFPEPSEEYFKNWDKVVVPDTLDKSVLRWNIEAQEKNNKPYYESFAKARGISVKEYKGLLQKRMEEIISKCDFFRATDFDVLEYIVHTDGRWKSQFETGTSDGANDPEFRSECENVLFGFKNDIHHDTHKRAIYGYWTDNENGVLNREGKNPPPNTVVQYGLITFKVKKEKALSKATITFNDSLGSSVKNDALPVLAQKPHFSAFPIHRGEDPLDKFTVGNIHKWRDRYTETQFHGGLSMEDIESVHLSHNNGLTDNHVNEVIEQLYDYAISKGTKAVKPKYYTNK